MNETWKDIKGYEGYYQVSNLGNVKGIDRYIDGRWGKQKMKGVILKQAKTRSGYNIIALSINGNNHTRTVHRIVAQVFIPNPENKRIVNHINGIKTDNTIDNLEWATDKENTKHAFDTGLINNDNMKKKVAMLSLDNEPIKVFNSFQEAEAYAGVKYQNISMCCRGKRKTTGGYKWEYYYET